GPLLHFNGECCPSEDLWKGSIAGKGLRPPVVAASGKDITNGKVNAKEDSKNQSGCAKAKLLEWSM
ncbi:hypothetical protein M513_14231, partial [Trichuris suis]